MSFGKFVVGKFGFGKFASENLFRKIRCRKICCQKMYCRKNLLDPYLCNRSINFVTNFTNKMDSCLTSANFLTAGINIYSSHYWNIFTVDSNFQCCLSKKRNRSTLFLKLTNSWKKLYQLLRESCKVRRKETGPEYSKVPYLYGKTRPIVTLAVHT